MRICACYCVLNEEDYLEYSIRSLINAVDEVIIVHGSTTFAPLHNNGLSVDNTSGIISKMQKEYPDKIKKIMNVGMVANRMMMQNIYVGMVNEGDWILRSDGDEIWDEKELLGLRRALGARDPVEAYVWQIELRNSFKYHLPIKFVPGRDNFFDRDKKPYYNGFIQERIYRRIPGMDVRHRKYHTHVDDRNGRALYGDAAYEAKRFRASVHFYHFGRICCMNKFILKASHIRCQNVDKKPWSELTQDRKNEIIVRTRNIWYEDNAMKADFAAAPALPPILNNHPFKDLSFKKIPNNPVYELEL